MRAIVVSGALAALAGGLYAVVLLVITPQSVFGMLTSAQALVVTLFGGVGTMWGPVVGASILVPLSETLQAHLGNVIPGIQGVVYGLAIIFVILVAPEGVLWRVRDRLAAHRASACAGPRSRTAVVAHRRRRAATRAARLGRTADPGGDGPVEVLRWPQGGGRGRLQRSERLDPRHHRAQRRGQDDAVQPVERVLAPRCRPRAVPGPGPGGVEAEPHLPARRGPHVPGGACVRPHVGAAERRVRRARGCAFRRRSDRDGAGCAGAGRSRAACGCAAQRR